MCTLPPFVRILGIAVCVREAEDWELSSDEAAKCFPSSALIVYDGKVDYQELRDSVMHEIVHYIDFKMHGEFTLQESQVCMIAANIVPILQDNDDFSDWLRSRD